MKTGISVLFILLFLNFSHAQSIGFTGDIIQVGNYPSNGFGLSINYNFKSNSNFEYLINSSFFYTSDNSLNNLGKLEYKHIPVFFGIRYYITKDILQPYLSVEAGLSYFKNDQMHETINSQSLTETTKTVKSFEGIYLGVSPAIGTMIKLSDSIKLNINAKFYLISERYADLLAFSGGIVFNI